MRTCYMLLVIAAFQGQCPATGSLRAQLAEVPVLEHMRGVAELAAHFDLAVDLQLIELVGRNDAQHVGHPLGYVATWQLDLSAGPPSGPSESEGIAAMVDKLTK